jgi:hypothetical protein
MNDLGCTIRRALVFDAPDCDSQAPIEHQDQSSLEKQRRLARRTQARCQSVAFVST